MTSGVQSIQRAFAVLRLIAARNDAGVGLAELVELSGLKPSTTHRLVGALIKERFVERQPGTKRYHLGLDFFSIGSQLSKRHDFQDIARPAMLRLAEKIGDTIFLSIRSEDDSVCISRIEGSYPIKALTLSIGSRRPLGIGAGSLALLSALNDAEIDEILERNRERIESYSGYNRSQLLRSVVETRARGYSLNDGRIIKGMSAMGIAIFGGHDEFMAALSIAAISDRLTQDRRARNLERLLEAKEAIAQRLGNIKA